MKTYEIHEKIKLVNQKSFCFKYIGDVTASSVSEAKNFVEKETGISPSKLDAKLK